MNENRYAAAGWASILSAAGTLAVLGLSFVFELGKAFEPGRGIAPAVWTLQQIALVAAVDAIAWALGIYALVRFRDLLRERYGFHAIDHLIWVVVGAGLLAAVVSYGHRLMQLDGPTSLASGFASMLVIGILNGAVGIVFATRLRKVNGNLNGYKNALFWLYLAGSVCFLLVIPALVGMVLLSAWNLVLGLVFFRGEELEELEVV